MKNCLVSWFYFNFCDNKTPIDNRFEFLDGYRGSLALIVAIAHAVGVRNCVFFNLIIKLAQKYSIAGFFLLSAFLLTHRLLKDLHKPNASIILCVLQYAIRRFFRIYVIFALFLCAAIYGPKFIAGFTYGRYQDLPSILALGYVGRNHLWTIAPEIKFYFLIPIICLIFLAMRRFAPLFLAACLTWTAYDQFFNFFDLKADDIFSFSKQANLLKNHFAVFFIGSELAMTLFLIERSERITKWIKHEKVQIVLNSSLLMALYALVFHTEIRNRIFDYKYRSQPAVFWALVLLMALLSDCSRNLVVRFFANNGFLKSCGKFSFGIYLLHPAAIQFVRSFKYVVENHMSIFLSVFLSFIFGWLVYYLLEKHLITFANFLCSKIAYMSFFTFKTEHTRLENNNEI